MGSYVDDGNDIVYVPQAEVEGSKKNVDGSSMFKLVGGPYHDCTLRVYPPYDEIRFDGNKGFRGQGQGPIVYRIHPPLRSNGKWVYVHDANPDS